MGLEGAPGTGGVAEHLCVAGGQPELRLAEGGLRHQLRLPDAAPQVLPAVQIEVVEEQQRGHPATIAPSSRGDRPAARYRFLVVAGRWDLVAYCRTQGLAAVAYLGGVRRRAGAARLVGAVRLAGVRRFGAGPRSRRSSSSSAARSSVIVSTVSPVRNEALVSPSVT